MSSLIDVIIPVYNCEKYLDQCIESITGQTVKAIEIFARDDASKDQSLELLHKHQNIKVSKNLRNLGNLETINLLLENTNAAYIAFQDSDDWSECSRFEEQLQFLKSNNLDFCFSGYIKVDDTGSQELYRGRLQNNIIIDISNCKELSEDVCFASVMMKRSVYEKIGGFHPIFNHIGSADLDWMYRAILNGFKAGILSKPLYYYRNNPASYTSWVSLNTMKFISPQLADHLFEERFKKKDANFIPTHESIAQFARTKLAQIGFNKKEHIRNYIIQQINNRKFVSAIRHFPKFLLSSPKSLKDLKLFNFLLFSILNAKR